MKFVQVALIASTASFSAALDATRGGRRRRELEDIGDIETMSMSMIDGTMVTADAVSSQGRSKSAKSKSAKEPVNENICAGATGYALPQIPRTGAVTCSGATELNKPSKNEDTWTKFPQTGGNVSCGSNGKMDVGELKPNKIAPFTKNAGACVTNLHIHLGAEHRSDGEYGPEFGANGPYEPVQYNSYRAKHFDPADEHFTRIYNFKHCDQVKVGETYEIHWPQATSTFAACENEDWQYQNTFTDGLLCNYAPAAGGLVAGDFPPQAIADNIGVEAQIFTVVNNFDNDSTLNEHDHMDLISGPVHSYDWTYYTGSRTGGGFGFSLDDENCDDVSPVSWKVDRKARLVTAKAFDKLCEDMGKLPGMRACGAGCRDLSGYMVDDEGCCTPNAQIESTNTRKVVVADLQSNNLHFDGCGGRRN